MHGEKDRETTNSLPASDFPVVKKNKKKITQTRSRKSFNPTWPCSPDQSGEESDTVEFWSTHNALEYIITSTSKARQYLGMQISKMAQRGRVIELYRTLLHLGRDYPQGYDYFRVRCHNAFMKNQHVSDPKAIDALVAKAEYVVKELEALYMLKKYRTLKRRYYADPPIKEAK